MRVCYLTTELSNRHGWGRYSLEIVRHIKQQGIEPVVLCASTATRDALPGVDTYPVLTPWGDGRRGAWLRGLVDAVRIRRYVAQCDLVHCLTEPYAVVAALSSASLPLILTGVGTYAVAPLRRPLAGTLLRYAYRKARRVVCVSRYTESRIRRYLPWAQTTVVPLGVDYAAFQRPDPPPRSSSEERIILSVGAIKPRKGYHISIEAMARVQPRITNLQYVIIGATGSAPGYYAALKRLVADLGLQDTVRFLGEVSDEVLIAWYHGCDLFVLTPINEGDWFEGFGLVYLEANACGKPVIGSRDCGAEEAIRHGYNGFLVPQRDVAITAETILRVLQNQELADSLSRNALEQAKTMSWDRVVRELSGIYKGL